MRLLIETIEHRNPDWVTFYLKPDEGPDWTAVSTLLHKFHLDPVYPSDVVVNVRDKHFSVAIPKSTRLRFMRLLYQLFVGE